MFVNVFVFFAGSPSKLSVTCSTFVKSADNYDYNLQLFSKSSIQSHIICSITDCYGNQTPTKTFICMDWSPSNAGSTLNKKSNAKGQVIFQSNSVKCFAETGSAKFKLFTPEIKCIKVILNFS